MMAKKRILSWLVAASLALSLLPAAALAADETETTAPSNVTDEILAPGMDDIVDPADSAASDLIDSVEESETEEAVKKADNTVTEVGKITSKIDDDLKVDVPVEDSETEEGEVEEGATEKKNVDDAIADEAQKANDAKADAEQAAADAAAAVEAEDEEALAQAKKDAVDAVVKADEAYNKAQEYFDTVIDRLLTSEDDKQALAGKVEELLKDVAVPGADATEEEKAAYESAKVDAENAAKLELANGKLDDQYADVQKIIEEAQKKLTAAQDELSQAKETYDTAMKNAQDAAGNVKIGDYVDYFNKLEDSGKVTEVKDAYGNLDSAEKVTQEKQTDADKVEENLPEDQRKTDTGDRIKRDQDFLAEKCQATGTYISGDPQLRHAISVVQHNSKILV